MRQVIRYGMQRTHRRLQPPSSRLHTARPCRLHCSMLLPQWRPARLLLPGGVKKVCLHVP